jgi:hypothetical protein
MQLNAITSVSDNWHKRHQQPESSDSIAHCNNGLCFICLHMLALKEQHTSQPSKKICMCTHHRTEKVIIIIIGTKALFEPRPSSEASASCPYRSFNQSSYFGQSDHCFFRFLNNVFFQSRLSALHPTPSNPGGLIRLLLSLGFHHSQLWHGKPYQ